LIITGGLCIIATAVADLAKAASISAAPNADYNMNMSNALKRLGRVEEGERDVTEARKFKKCIFGR
jgi:hypothetical protein